jgi:hypothetical protein
MKIRQRLDLKPERAGFNVEQVSAVLPVDREKVKVIAGDAEGA